MEKFAAFIVRFRWPILVVILVITGFFFWAMGKLEIKTDFMSSTDPDEPVVKIYDYLGETFGGNDIALVALKTSDVFKREILQAMRDFARRVETIPEVDTVLSLTEIIDIKQNEWGVEVGDLFARGELPSQAEIDKLRDYILRKEMYTLSLIHI